MPFICLSEPTPLLKPDVTGPVHTFNVSTREAKAAQCVLCQPRLLHREILSPNKQTNKDTERKGEGEGKRKKSEQGEHLSQQQCHGFRFSSSSRVLLA